MPAYYADTVGNFRAAPLGQLELALIAAYESDRYKDLITTQITAWRSQIQDLKDAFGTPNLERFSPDSWGIAIEFVVPRKMGRIDAVLLIGNSIAVLEFKGESVDSSAADQGGRLLLRPNLFPRREPWQNHLPSGGWQNGKTALGPSFPSVRRTTPNDVR